VWNSEKCRRGQCGGRASTSLIDAREAGRERWGGGGTPPKAAESFGATTLGPKRLIAKREFGSGFQLTWPLEDEQDKWSLLLITLAS